MEGEWTVGSLFEDLSERADGARTRALMGEREPALCHLLQIRRDYDQFREVLDSFPGSLSLRQKLEEAIEALSCEKDVISGRFPA